MGVALKKDRMTKKKERKKEQRIVPNEAIREYVPNEDDGLFTDSDDSELYTPKFEASQEEEGDVF